jgi:phosphomannomutase/phosphoglucomutase
LTTPRPWTPYPRKFSSLDIRGIVGTTPTAEIVRKIGHALGSEARSRKQAAVAVGYDGGYRVPPSPQHLRTAFRKPESM